MVGTVEKVRTEIVRGGEKQQPINGRWWLESEIDAGANAYLVAEKIRQQQTSRTAANLKHARLYKNIELTGLQAGTFARSGIERAFSERVTFNVIRQCIDTATNKIAKNRPRPIFLTSGGDWALKKKAKNLTKFIDGIFDLEKVYQKAQKVFADALIFGLGVMHIYQHEGEIKYERVIPEEILVDEMDGVYQQPKQLHRVKYIHRDVLHEMFSGKPEIQKHIADAPVGMAGDEVAQFAGDLVAVVESWHLKSSTTAKDGRRCLSISGATLLVENYDFENFPFVFFRWSEDLMGFYGTGVAEELAGIQIEINKLLKNIQQAQKLVAVPRIFIERGSSINKAHLTNEISGIIEYTGTKPSMETAQGMNTEVYNHLDRLYNKAFEIVGISQLSAASKKPAGLTAAVALREFNDIESERFAVVGQNWELFFLDIAKVTLEIGEQLYATGKNISINVAGKNFIEKMKWSEVSLEKDSYVLRCFPASLLPTQPAGRLEMVQELIQGGFLDKDEGLSLLDFPDLEKTVSLKNSAIDDLVQQLELIIESKRYTTPEPYQNLKLGVKLGQAYYLKARATNVGLEEQELLRRFVDDCEMMLKEQQEMAAPVAQPPLPEIPLAQPEAVPTSDLLPLGQNFKTVV